MNSRLYGRTLFAVVALALIVSLPAAAQVLKGSISGMIIDSQGLAVSGAEVKATQVDTDAIFKTTSTASGVFRLNLLPLGHYTVEILAQDLKTVFSQGVLVTAGSDSAMGSVRLSIGATPGPSETPTTATSLAGGQSQITSLTSDAVLHSFSGIQENQGLDKLALFVPGVIDTRSNRFSNANGAAFSVNGLRGRNNDQLLDGQTNNDNLIAGPSLYLSDPNFVQQYVITTGNFGPEYGRNAASVVNIMTKSGTNAWHGSMYGMETHSSLNAASTGEKFNRALGRTNPNINREFSGFTIGGPWIKNKLFVFGGFDDDIRNTSAVFSTSALTPTPTGLEQLTACGAAINPTALSVLKQFGPYAFTAGNPTPLPNSTTGLFTNLNVGTCVGVQFGGVTRSLDTPSHVYGGVVRADLQLGSDVITGRYFFWLDKIFNSNDGGAGGWFRNATSNSHDILLSWTHTLSPHAINEARISFGRSNTDFGGNDAGNPFETNRRHIGDALTNVFFGGGFLGFGPSTNTPQARIQNTWQAQDNWSYVWGQHQFKAGMSYSYQRSPNISLPLFNGSYGFSNMTTFLTTNTANRIQIAEGNPETDFREHNTFVYVGDDWKATENLTVNFGLTWSYFTQPVNLFHEITTKRESNPATAFWNPTLPLAVRTTPSVPNVNTNFGPNVGFAYSPQWGGFLTGHGKTVVRGGYRLLYDPVFYNVYTVLGTSLPVIYPPGFLPSSTPRSLPALPTGRNVRAQLLPFIALGVSDPRMFDGVPESTVDANLRPDQVHSWSFGLERELTRNSVFEARYVGNHAPHLLQAVNANPFIADLKAAFPNVVPSKFTPCPGAAAFNFPAQGRIHCDQGPLSSFISGASSSYNGIQLEFRANNLFRQLTMRTGYTWSKTLDNTSEIFNTNSAGNTSAYAQNPLDIGRGERSISGLDIPHVFTLLFIEELPFFREQHGATGHLLGGWALSGNYLAASGQPYTPVQRNEAFNTTRVGDLYDSQFAAVTGFDIARPFYGNRHAPADSVGIFAGDACLLRGGVLCVVPATQLLSLNAINHSSIVQVTTNDVRFIVNTGIAHTAFGTPFGNVPRGAMRDAPQNILNLSISKQTKITERVGLKFHLTALNALNHFNFRDIDPFVSDAGLETLPTSFGVGFAHPEVTNATGRTVYLGAKISF